jgi:hypothetical protein
MAGSDSSRDCTAEVAGTQDPTVANIEVVCGDRVIDNVELRLNERNEGTLEGEEGNTTCQPDDVSLTFNCQPSGDNDGSTIRAQLAADDSDEVCAEPRLEIDFTVTFDDDSTEDIDNVEVSGCSESGSGGDEDSGATPEGGVDSGAGGTATPAATGPALPLAGAALVILAGASLGVFMRRTRTTP